VLEGIPARLLARITEILSVLTLDANARSHCSGQVLILYEVLGLPRTIGPSRARSVAAHLASRGA
jgi:3-methyl-2-oxobutanoate hydroxymethyltransferase